MNTSLTVFRFFFFSSRRRHTRWPRDWSSDVCSSDLEFMDVGNHNNWDMNAVVSKKEIVERINEEMPLSPAEGNYYGEVASRYKYDDGGGEIGVISSVTDAFCGTCSRMRLSADGKLYTCLFATGGFDIKQKLRAGLTDEQLIDELTGIWENRTDRYSEERANIDPSDREKIEMSYIGG